MQFQGKLNEAEVREATRFVRPRGYARRMAATYVRLTIYALIVLWFLFETFVRRVHIPAGVIAFRVVILALIIVYLFYRQRKTTRDSVAALDASLPDSLDLSPEGVRLDGPAGAHGFQPWASYTGFREGRHVVMLRRREHDLYNVLAISSLSPAEREALRGQLKSYIPELSK